MLTTRSQKARRECVTLIEKEGLQAMVVAAYDYRGHKGMLRYVSDYDLPHRYGYAVVSSEGRVVLVLGEGLRWAGAHHTADEAVYADQLGPALAKTLRTFGVDSGRVGVAGLRTIMPTGDFLDLRDDLPAAEFIDVTPAFQTMRARKDADDLNGAMEANALAERGYETVLSTIRPGASEQAVSARAIATMVEGGGVDTLPLVWSGRHGTCGPFYRVPEGRILESGDIWTYSIEVTGPSGCWVELARVVSLGGDVSSITRSMHAHLSEALTSGAEAMRPGATGDDVQKVIESVLSRGGYRTGHLTGHGIGIDVLESPWIGRGSQSRFEEGMIASVHPHVVDSSGTYGLYMSDTFVVGQDGARPLSSLSRDIIVIPD